MTDGIRRAAVIGYPIAHSRSPLIHGHWIEQFGITGHYDKIEVHPDDVRSFLMGLAERGLVGCNVTLPHKEAAFQAVQNRDRHAEALEAVNTVWLENGELCGSNTDAFGFLANLDDLAAGWGANGGPAVVLGAGGASRAIIHALIDRDVTPVHVINRTLPRAEALQEFFGSKVRAHGWSELLDLLSTCRILVNTTSLGMEGQPPLEVPMEALPQSALVTDIVYTPLITPLLASAQERGLRIVDGLGMLLHQARPGFEKWFGPAPTVDETLRSLIVKDLESHT